MKNKFKVHYGGVSKEQEKNLENAKNAKNDTSQKIKELVDESGMTEEELLEYIKKSIKADNGGFPEPDFLDFFKVLVITWRKYPVKMTFAIIALIVPSVFVLLLIIRLLAILKAKIF